MLTGLEKVEMEKLSLCENKSFPAKAFHCGAVQYQEVARAARVCKLQLFSPFLFLILETRIVKKDALVGS